MVDEKTFASLSKARRINGLALTEPTNDFESLEKKDGLGRTVGAENQGVSIPVLNVTYSPL